MYTRENGDHPDRDVGELVGFINADNEKDLPQHENTSNTGFPWILQQQKN